MKLRLAAPVAALTLAGATLPAIATSQPPGLGEPTAWAATALGAKGASAYRFETVRTSLIGTHVRGRQFRGGLPVEGTEVLVTAVGGRVVQVEAFGSALPGLPAVHPVGPAAARAAALRRLAVRALLVPTTTQRVLVPVGGRLVDTYQVSVIAQRPATAARVDIEAATGRVLHVVDAAKHDDAAAKVFDPNPVVTSRNTKLRSFGETHRGVAVPLDAPELTSQLRTVRLRGLDHAALQQGRLTGPYANVLGAAGYLNPPFSYSRSDPRFVGLMAYAHVDRYQRWLQSLGLRNVNASAQTLVPTLVQGFDNSMYRPAEDVIIFGGGGVPDAEDAEVILHEYGHAMQDDQVPGYGATQQGGSMGEGFGDFNAANYYALTSKGFGDACVAEWDSTSYAKTNPPCLRRMDSRKHYPRDLDRKNEDVHADGEMWSAFLWRLRAHLGSTPAARSANAIKLVLSSHELLTSRAGFGDGVAALRNAAKALHRPDWATWVDREAAVTGFPRNP